MQALKILIIDDDRDLAESMAEYLELDGHQVDLQFTSGAGVACASVGDYDQIIIDIGLPDLNGVDSMNAIRKARPQARIFLITGYSASHLNRLVDRPDDVDVLTKPIDLGALSRRLAALADSLTPPT